MIETTRRSFLTGLVAFTAAAPAIVRVTSIMPVSAAKLLIEPPLMTYTHHVVIDRLLNMPVMMLMNSETWDKVSAGEHPRYVFPYPNEFLPIRQMIKAHGSIEFEQRRA